MSAVSPSVGPYPLLFEPILKDKVWGGRRLERLGKRLPPGVAIGESWELADLSATAASGGGGGEARSEIRNGALAGRRVGDAVREWGATMMGEALAGHGDAFPLLVKYLDAREHLSVQVHPSPAYCRAHPEAHLKTECWYVLNAEPGSVIYKGVRAGVSRNAFAKALAAGQGEGVVELMEAVPARVGECHNLPSGTVHALGAGVLVAEVQTPSDTTFRVYDWAKEYGRKGRELHVEQSMACIQFEPARDATRLGGGATRGTLVSTGYFGVEEIRLQAGERVALVEGEIAARPQVVMVVRGAGTLRSSDGAFEDVRVGLGETTLVPAGIAARTAFIASEPTTILRADVRGAVRGS